MKKIKYFTYSICALAVASLAASCADYNDTGFKVEAPEVMEQGDISNYNSIKTYVDRSKYPNFKISTALSAGDFNKRELVYTVANSNFDEIALGNAMKYASVVGDDGKMNFGTIIELLGNAEKSGLTVYGHTLAWHAQQNVKWLNKQLGDIEIPVEFISDYSCDYSEATSYEGTVISGARPTVIDGALQAVDAAKFYLAEGFDIDRELEYEITVMARSSKNVSATLTFADNKLLDNKLTLTPEWNTFTIKAKPASDNGYLQVEAARYKGTIDYAFVKVGHYPYAFRAQTDKEKADTLTYEMNRWVDGIMKACAGRVKAWDMINEAVSGGGNVNGNYDLQHASGNANDFFWQDYLGNENYGPVVEKAARKAWKANGGDPAELKLFVNDYNLESDWDNNKKLKSLIYWVGVWENNGAKIDGLGSQMHISYYENKQTMASKARHMVQMLHMMANTGKLVRISELDMGYIDNNNVTLKAPELTKEQRQNMANYYRFIIQMYLKIVPVAQQYGICHWCLTDSKADSGWRAGEPVGLWTLEWQRTPAYAAYCEALSTPILDTEDYFEYLDALGLTHYITGQ